MESEIGELLSKHEATDPDLFEALVAGEEVAITAQHLLGIILKQDALEQAVLRLARLIDELVEKAPSGLEPE